MSSDFSIKRIGSLVVATLAVTLIATGCASKRSPSLGQSTAAMAQAQMQEAERSTQIDTTKTYLDLIEQMQQAGHWYASLAHTEAFAREHGSSPEIRLLRADALRNTQQYEEALKVYHTLFNTPKAARAHRGIGLLEASQGRYTQAIEALEKSRQLNPIDANVLSDIAYAHMLAGQLEQARLPVLQAAQLAPSDARVQLNLALFWLASGEQALGAQLIERLRQPQAKQGGALIDQRAIESLQMQLQKVNQAALAKRTPAPIEPAQSNTPMEQKVGVFDVTNQLADIRNVSLVTVAQDKESP